MAALIVTAAGNATLYLQPATEQKLNELFRIQLGEEGLSMRVVDLAVSTATKHGVAIVNEATLREIAGS